MTLFADRAVVLICNVGFVPAGIATHPPAKAPQTAGDAELEHSEVFQENFPAKLVPVVPIDEAPALKAPLIVSVLPAPNVIPEPELVTLVGSVTVPVKVGEAIGASNPSAVVARVVSTATAVSE